MSNAILIPLLTGLIGLFVGHRLSLVRDVRASRAKFRGIMSSIKLEIDLTHNDRFVDWCRNSMVKVAEEAFRVSCDIPLLRQKRFCCARDAYCQTKRPDIQDPKRDDLPALAAQPTTYDKGRDWMRTLLVELIDCAK